MSRYFAWVAVNKNSKIFTVSIELKYWQCETLFMEIKIIARTRHGITSSQHRPSTRCHMVVRSHLFFACSWLTVSRRARKNQTHSYVYSWLNSRSWRLDIDISTRVANYEFARMPRPWSHVLRSWARSRKLQSSEFAWQRPSISSVHVIGGWRNNPPLLP